VSSRKAWNSLVDNWRTEAIVLLFLNVLSISNAVHMKTQVIAESRLKQFSVSVVILSCCYVECVDFVRNGFEEIQVTFMYADPFFVSKHQTTYKTKGSFWINIISLNISMC